MFNKDFVWNCPVCGNLNTYDSVVIKENITNQLVGFAYTKETVILCHHCLYKIVARLREGMILLEKLSEPSYWDKNYLRNSCEAIPYSTKVSSSMEATSIQQKCKVIYKGICYQILSSLSENEARRALVDTCNSGELCRRTFQEFDTIHVRNIFEYYATLEYITDICRQVKLPYTISAPTEILPINFNKNDYLLEFNLCNNKMDITSIEHDIETVGLVYCVSYIDFATHLEDYITMLSKP